MEPTGGIGAANRQLVERLHRVGGPVTVREAALAWDLDLLETRRLLGYLARRGWLTRVRRGLYTPVPLDARAPGTWTEDPWVVASLAFAPCYIGGWSACEHWALTEQPSRTVFVFSAKRVRHRAEDIQGTPIRIKVVNDGSFFGLRVAWRGQNRVHVSDPSRTIIDLLADPAVGGGIGHVADILREYLGSSHRNDDLLVEYADRIHNGAVFKRLGFILEASDMEAAALIAACRARVRTGIIALDPSIAERGRIVRRWGLRANADVTGRVPA